jgi:hypothetical protein
MKEHITETEAYLLGIMPETERLLFEAKMLADPALQEDVKHQRRAIQMIRWYGRDLQRERLSAIYDALDAEFHLTITSIFK